MAAIRNRLAANPRRRPHHRTRASRRNLGWKFKVAALGCVAIFGLLLLGLLARAYAPTSNTNREQFDAIIVLGNPADSDGNPTPTQLARVTEAVHEYERGAAPRIILTGGAAHNQYVEAKVMARTAEAQGIPESAVFLEPQALDTIQNACYSVRIMKQHGWGSAEVVSSPSHLPRAGLILSHLPIQWRTHGAPTLAPESGLVVNATNLVEILKTTRYLIWTRQMEQCQP